MILGGALIPPLPPPRLSSAANTFVMSDMGKPGLGLGEIQKETKLDNMRIKGRQFKGNPVS